MFSATMLQSLPSKARPHSLSEGVHVNSLETLTSVVPSQSRAPLLLFASPCQRG